MASTPDGLGAGLLAALIQPSSFIARRVETIRFTEDGQARRFVSVDLDLAELQRRFGTAGADADRLVVPLTLLRKSPLALLDVRAEDGSALPVLNTRDNGHLAYSALHANAAAVLGVGPNNPMSDELAEALEVIARGSRENASLRLNQLLTSASGESLKLANDLVFRKMAGDLAENFVMLAVLHSEKAKAKQTVLKFSYASSLATGDANPAALWRRSYKAAEGDFEVVLPSVADAASYHIQIVPPVGVQVGDIRMRIRSLSQGSLAEVAGSKNGNVGSAYVSALAPGSSASVHIRLSAASRGTVAAALLACVVAAVLLGGLAFLSTQRIVRLQQQEAEAALVVLLALSGIVTSYIARPGEPNILARLLAGVRIRLMVATVALLADGVLITLAIEGTAYRFFAVLFFVVALLSTLSLGATWVRCRVLEGAS